MFRIGLEVNMNATNVKLFVIVAGVLLAAVLIGLKLLTDLKSRKKKPDAGEEDKQTNSEKDYLTGLPNRFSLLNTITDELGKKRAGEMLLFVNIDIDDFKIINYSKGNTCGDAVIAGIAEKLSGLLDKDDVLGRVGGDEFMLMFSHIVSDAEGESKIADIMNVFKNANFGNDKDGFIQITASAGVMTVKYDDMVSIQDVMNGLESALMYAKESGKNTYKFFDRTVEEMMVNKVRIETDLKTAIEENQFELYYQPQINLATKKIGGFEALVRWHHPKRGLVPPMEFISIAEKSNLIIEIGRIVLNNACRQLADWHENGYKVRLSVNLSAKQFKDPGLMDYIIEMLNVYNVDPRYLELEITETAAVDDVEYTVRTLEKLKKYGISFSLDDFGTGYSSMNYLRQLPVDNLKIDKSFMDSAVFDGNDRKIVESIIQLAKVLNIAVTAEGVEASEQEKLLKDLNCNRAQGFLYSRPVPAPAAMRLIA